MIPSLVPTVLNLIEAFAYVSIRGSAVSGWSITLRPYISNRPDSETEDEKYIYFDDLETVTDVSFNGAVSKALEKLLDYISSDLYEVRNAK